MGKMNKNIKLDRKNMTNSYDEYLDWTEYCLNKMDDKISELEGVQVRRITNPREYSYGFAAGLKYAIGLIMGEIEE